MRMHGLCLIGLETIETNHYVRTRPDSCFEKLFGVSTFEVTPV